jgi:hypothetical protein
MTLLREAGVPAGFEVLLPPGAGLFLTGMDWFRTHGVEVRLGVPAVEVEKSDDDGFRRWSTVSHDSLGHQVRLGVERRRWRKGK